MKWRKRTRWPWQLTFPATITQLTHYLIDLCPTINCGNSIFKLKGGPSSSALSISYENASMAGRFQQSDEMDSYNVENQLIQKLLDFVQPYEQIWFVIRSISWSGKSDEWINYTETSWIQRTHLRKRKTLQFKYRNWIELKLNRIFVAWGIAIGWKWIWIEYELSNWFRTGWIK